MNQKSTFQWSSAGRSHVGMVRAINEDACLAMPELGLWTVADGMGGHEAGQIASEAALKILIRSYFANPVDSVDGALRQALADANTLLVEAARQLGHANGMGSTMVIAVVHEDTLTIAHLGDSRAYLLRDGERVRPLTVDHSWVEEQVRRGALTRAEAERSPYRNVVTRSLGMEGQIEPEISVETLLPGDLVLLASDGVTNYLDGDALATLTAGLDLSRAALALVDAANDAGGKDNSTVVLLRVDAITAVGEAD